MSQGLLCYVCLLMQTIYWLSLQHFLQFLFTKQHDFGLYKSFRKIISEFFSYLQYLQYLQNTLKFSEREDGFLHRSREYLFAWNFCCLLRWTIHWVPLSFWVLSQFEFSNFINIWFVAVLSQVEFLSFVIICVFEFCHQFIFEFCRNLIF